MKNLYKKIYNFKNNINIINLENLILVKNKYLVEYTTFKINNIEISMMKAFLSNGYYYQVKINNVIYIIFHSTIFDFFNKKEKFFNKIILFLRKLQKEKTIGFIL